MLEVLLEVGHFKKFVDIREILHETVPIIVRWDETRSRVTVASNDPIVHTPDDTQQSERNLYQCPFVYFTYLQFI
jgi:hypothetical protein